MSPSTSHFCNLCHEHFLVHASKFFRCIQGEIYLYKVTVGQPERPGQILERVKNKWTDKVRFTHKDKEEALISSQIYQLPTPTDA